MAHLGTKQIVRRMLEKPKEAQGQEICGFSSVNDQVQWDEETVEIIKFYHINYDQFTGNMHVWIDTGYSPKTQRLGRNWTAQRDAYHGEERGAAFWGYYMPGAPIIFSSRSVASHSTGSMSSAALFARDYNRWEARKLAAKQKFDQGLELSPSEQINYEQYVDEQRFDKHLVVVSGWDSEWDDHKDLTSSASDPKAIKSVNNPSAKPENTSWLRCKSIESNKVVSSHAENTDWGLDYVVPTKESERLLQVYDYTPQSILDPYEEQGVMGTYKESPASTQSCALTDAEDNAWFNSTRNYKPGCIDVEPTQFELKMEYATGIRGKRWVMPFGMGLHVRLPPQSCNTWASIMPDEMVENPPADLPYVIKQQETFASTTVQQESSDIAAQEIDSEEEVVSQDPEVINALYDVTTCHKDASWLQKANPNVTKSMVDNMQAKVDYNKDEARKTIDHLKLFGTNLQLLTPMMHSVMKDTNLCKAIHAELVKRDIGFLKKDDNKSFRFHGRVVTILANLHRWAMMDIQSAIEDLRLILEDHELMLEMIEALNGGVIQQDKPLIDPVATSKTCAGCKKNMRELGVIYGRDHSTLMATGCRVCEDARLERAYHLLWKWEKEPELLSDDEYLQVFGVEKGFVVPSKEDEADSGAPFNFDDEVLA